MTTQPIIIDRPLTLGEIEYIETTSGVAIDQFETPGVPKTPFLVAIITVLKRRQEPDWKLADTRNIPFSELRAVLDLGDQQTMLKLGLAEEIEVDDEEPKSA